ncbi:PBP1A family penicillin-binding protein [candidate division KSB1 bacterium]|nr:PBP1A family penicillin-binding protein [candidate division KSB1 bacterium]
MLKRIIKIGVISVALFISGTAIYALLRLPQIPDDLNKIALASPTKIYADDGQLIKTLADRQIVPIEQISSSLVNAVLVLEDEAFYSHHGISKRGLLRAFISNLRVGRVTQGGSTITQQLAKNLFFSFERSWMRKVQELFVTLQIEQQFSKDDILEAYLNQIDFGSGIYGIELAAQTYFSKHADELTTAEAAMLAGIPRWPARYNPYKYPDIAKERQLFVLKRMLDEQVITTDEYSNATVERLSYRRIYDLYGHAEYFIDAAVDQASEEFGRHAVMYGGLDIYTTLSSRYQLAASRAVKDGLTELDDLIGLEPYETSTWAERETYPQAALVAIDPKTGAVKALVGGRDYQRAPFNRALGENRAPGSAFKPITYLAALDKGLIDPSMVMVDEPTQFRIYNQVWEPRNFDRKYRGPLTLKMALAESRNVIAAKVIEKVTPQVVVDYARDLGIKGPLEPHLSLGLGAASVSPLEMAAAFATIVSQGFRREPYMIRKIFSTERNLFDHKLESQRVIDPQTCYVLIDMLTGVIEYGTATDVQRRGFFRPCAGKTGTTNDYRDAWFIGFTPDVVAAVWVGYDDNRPLRNKWGGGITGATGALPIWISFMKTVLKDTPYSEFPIPPGIEFLKVNPTTGEQVSAYEDGIRVAIRRGM